MPHTLFAFHYLISQVIEEGNVTFKNGYLLAATQNGQLCVFVFFKRIPYGEYFT